MTVIKDLLVVLALVFLVRAQKCNETLSITVDSQEGRDTERCHSGTEACRSLDYALEVLANSSCSGLSLTLVPRETAYTLSYKEVNLVGSVIFRSTNGKAYVNCIADYDVNRDNATIYGDNVTAVLRIRDGEDTLLEGVDFRDCQRPIRFENIPRLEIKDCSFRGATAAAVDLLNVWNVTISGTNVSDSFTLNLPEEFRGNAAGLGLRYRNALSSATATIHVMDCMFEGNTAGVPNSVESNSDQLRFNTLNRNVFFARGGGFGLFILSESTDNSTDALPPQVNFVMERCTFTSNTATVGGGLYIAPFGTNINHTFTVKQSTFVGNTANDIGGGVLIGFPSRFDYPSHITTKFENCTFRKNTADTAGGVAIVQSYPQGSGHKVEIVRCRFEENRSFRTGAGVQFASHAHLLVFEGAHFFYLVEDCIFIGNRGDGALATEYSHTEFSGRNLFQNNIGTSTEVSASLVRLNGSLTYINNTVDALRGGTLFINTFGQIKMMKGSSMNFTNNTGRIGAAIVVDVQEYSVPLSDLAGNPQCFLVYEDLQARPDEWEDVKIVFQGNRATVGPVIYASFLNSCSWFNDNITTKIFDINEFLQWRVFEMGQNWNTAHNSDNETYYVQTETVEVELLNEEMPRRWPGQLVEIPVRILDQYRNPTYAILRLTDIKANNLSQNSVGGANQEDDAIITATPDLTPLLPGNSKLSFHIHLPKALEDSYLNSELNNVTFVIDAPYNVRNLNRTVLLPVALLPCPPGYTLRSEDTDRLECLCVTDRNILQCLDESGKVVLQEGLWAGRYPDNPTGTGMVLFPCPQPHCVCQHRIAISLTDCLTLFNSEDPDSICFNNRTGILCGTCRADLGVGVLSTHCYPPIQYGYLIFLPLIVAQVVAAALIVLFGVRFPATLRGLLFYIQVAPYLTNFFPITFWGGKVFLYCFSTILAFYFPWDFSMYAGQPAEVSYFLTYEILPVVAATAAICVIIKYRARRWNGVWTLILLTSSLLLYISFGLLHCVYLPLEGDTRGSNVYRWYYNGNLTCFTTYHVPLALLAIAFLLAYAALTVALFVFTIRPKWKKFADFLLVVHRGYKEDRRWYGPFELLRRFVLIMFVVYMPGVSVFPICIVFLLFLVHTYALPYLYWWQNILEMVTFCILLIMLLFRSVAITPGVLGLEGENEVSVPVNNATMQGDLPSVDKLSGFLLFWYYLPVVVTAVSATVVLLCRLLHGPFGAKLKALQKEAEAEQNQDDRPSSVENTLAFSNSGVELVTYAELDGEDDGPLGRRPTKEDKKRHSSKVKHRRPTKDDDQQHQSSKDANECGTTKED